MKLFLTGMAIGVLALFFCGPMLIQWVYRVTTPAIVFEVQKTEYSRLANAELHLQGVPKKSAEKKRRRLFLWFQARGVPVDDGDSAIPFWQPWSDLIAYWRDDDTGRN